MQHLRIAIALIWRDNHILVQRRLPTADHLPNVWEFPGGKCEADETPRDAAIREVREELGIEIEIIRECETIDFEYSKDGSNRAITLFPFDAKIIEREPQTLASAELRWMLPHEMNIEEFPAANAPLIAQLKNNEPEMSTTGFA